MASPRGANSINARSRESWCKLTCAGVCIVLDLPGTYSSSQAIGSMWWSLLASEVVLPSVAVGEQQV